MANTIWKFRLLQVVQQAVSLPAGARLLHVGVQDNCWTLWALVDPSAPHELRQLRTVGTGHPIPEGAFDYLGTFQDPPRVWHLFEVKDGW